MPFDFVSSAFCTGFYIHCVLHCPHFCPQLYPLASRVRVARSQHHCGDPTDVAVSVALWYTVFVPHGFVAVPVAVQPSAMLVVFCI